MDLKKENLSLALDDIKNVISPRSYTYLTSILGESSTEGGSLEAGTLVENRSGSEDSCSSKNWSDSSERISTISSEQSEEIRSSGDETSSLKTGKGKNVSCFSEQSGGEIGNTAMAETRRHLNLSSLQKPSGITEENEAPCYNVVPVCRKILAKTSVAKKATIGERGRSRSVSEIAEKSGSCNGLEDSPYNRLITKIAPIPVKRDFSQEAKEKADFKNGTKKGLRRTATTSGLCDFSHPSSNPLYKTYNPKGYIKSEDELAREYIEKIGQDLNRWLSSLEGELVQLDPQILTTILRDELELP